VCIYIVCVCVCVRLALQYWACICNKSDWSKRNSKEVILGKTPYSRFH